MTAAPFSLDEALAEALSRWCPNLHPAVRWAVVQTSAAVARGDVCVPLAHLSAAWTQQHPETVAPDFAALLRASPAVAEATADTTGNTPLVLWDDRLYLRRTWQAEGTLVAAIRARLQQPTPPTPEQEAALVRRYPDPEDAQRQACLQALRWPFAVVTGGPGTGKTTTVATLLAIWQLGQPRVPGRIALAAPTGKAAARLTESLAAAWSSLTETGGWTAEDLAVLPQTVTTVHRLLGVNGQGGFRHHRHHPLPHALVVVDEASMLDVSLAAALCAALAPEARLVLLGDADQLSSVEAGSVLADVCTALADRPDAPVVRLMQSRRFDPDRGIGRLAAQVLQGGAWPDLETLAPDVSRTTESAVAEGYAPWIDLLSQRPEDPEAWSAWAAQVVHAFDRYRILTPLREGPSGVAALNQRCEARWFASVTAPGQSRWYAGRPVLITRNDATTGLSNGDVGVCLLGPGPQPLLRAVFPRRADPQGGPIRTFLPASLPAHETAFALTVHKSQGSEFDTVALVVPDLPPDAVLPPVINRALIYTGITRPRQRLLLIGPDHLWQTAIKRPIHRLGGLIARLQAGND